MNAPSRSSQLSAAAHPASPVLSIQNVTKRYGQTEAVRNVSVDLHDGESIALLGPSGSGKSTLLALVAGFQLPDAGRIMLRGSDVSRLSPSARRIGVVFQNYALFPHLTVAANIAYGLKMHGWPRSKRAGRVEEMIDLVGLVGLGERYPRQLSGGQQQRVALARALAFEPDLLLLDEPLAALDREIRIQMQAEIRRIRRQLQTPLIHVTHDREEAMALGDRIVIMRGGELVASGTPSELYDHPQSPFAAGFFSAFNIIEVDSCHVLTEETVQVEWLDQQIVVACDQPVPEGAEMRLLVPRFGPHIGPPTSAREVGVTGALIDAIYLGDVVELLVELAQPPLLTARVPAAEAVGLAPGQPVTIRISRHALRVVIT